MLKSRNLLRAIALTLIVTPAVATQAQQSENGKAASTVTLRGTVMRLYPGAVLIRDVSQREHIVQLRQCRVRSLNRKGAASRLTIGDEVVLTGLARSF